MTKEDLKLAYEIVQEALFASYRGKESMAKRDQLSKCFNAMLELTKTAYGLKEDEFWSYKDADGEWRGMECFCKEDVEAFLDESDFAAGEYEIVRYDDGGILESYDYTLAEPEYINDREQHGTY